METSKVVIGCALIVGIGVLRAAGVVTRRTFATMTQWRIAETLASHAANLCLEEPGKQQAVGLELNCNHVRAARSGTVTGTARALHVGRSTQVWDVRIEDEQGRLVCASRLTLAVRHG